MKDKRSNLSLLAATLLIAAAHAGTASAHTQDGSLGNPAGAADLYYVVCSDDGNGPPARLETQIKDRAGKKASLLSVQTQKDKLATNSTALRAGPYSPLITNAGGAGGYFVTVDKTQAGTKVYTVQYHCVTANGVHTGTGISFLQNQ